ncbi:MAG: CpsB/CapC family capsule biosynthesis tyrosine phosphatase [Thermodesulfobacteriota bacterium]|nr:CpsB/CapC family capsule biosynthesis tyrosine phosphatase [Thermodesulfobacteriota bacterium]
MIDIHCHILPAIDDGPADLDEALAMARIAAASGTRQIVATPHNGEVLHPPELLSARVTEFNALLQEHGIDLEVLVGAENVFFLSCDLFSHYCINGGRYLLIEFPHDHLPAQANTIIFELLGRGLLPIIAHPERNGSIVQQPNRLLELAAQGALVQLTAGSLAGSFGATVQRCARYLLKQGVVNFLASDGHSATWRPPDLLPGLKVAEKLIGKKTAHKMVVDNPRYVLADEDLPV